MSAHPLDPIKKHAPDLFARVAASREHALGDGALPAATKLLIAMALDAAHGASGGVASLARQALQHGATKEEVIEALEVAYYIAGAGAVYTASAGLVDLL